MSTKHIEFLILKGADNIIMSVLGLIETGDDNSNALSSSYFLKIFKLCIITIL